MRIDRPAVVGTMRAIWIAGFVIGIGGRWPAAVAVGVLAYAFNVWISVRRRRARRLEDAYRRWQEGMAAAGDPAAQAWVRTTYEAPPGRQASRTSSRSYRQPLELEDDDR